MRIATEAIQNRKRLSELKQGDIFMTDTAHGTENNETSYNMVIHPADPEHEDLVTVIDLLNGHVLHDTGNTIVTHCPQAAFAYSETALKDIPAGQVCMIIGYDGNGVKKKTRAMVACMNPDKRGYIGTVDIDTGKHEYYDSDAIVEPSSDIELRPYGTRQHKGHI